MTIYYLIIFGFLCAIHSRLENLMDKKENKKLKDKYEN